MSCGTEMTGTDPQIISLTQGLVHYVRELVKSSRKPVRNCDRYSAVVWLAGLPEGIEVLDTHDDGVVLALDHVPRRAHPALPRVLHGWVDAEGLDEPARNAPELAETGPGWVEDQREGKAATSTAAIVGRHEHLGVRRAYQEWIVQWRQWAAAEELAEPRRKLYTQLSQMAGKVAQADDVYEIVLAVGLLAKAAAGQQPVARHLVTKRLSFSIDRATARITVTLAADSPARLEDRDFLDTDDGYLLERSEPLRTQLAVQDSHPLAEYTTQLLTRWADVALDEGVRFSTTWARETTEDTAVSLSLTPALICRERDANALIQYYDRIAASLTGNQARSPLGLAQLIAPLEKADRLNWGEAETGQPMEGLEPEPLFPLPTNEAQRDVLDHLRSDTAVVVQGPPGTGKTHTIANLICALLAQGRRVLVTSEKDQALRVLREKLPAPVRNLCVLLTGLRRGGSEELERSITALSNTVASSSPDVVSRAIAELDGQRGMLLSGQIRLREDIRVLREAEWTEHPEVAPGYSGTLAAITRQVVTKRERFGWLPVLPSSAPGAVPVSTQDVLELRALLLTATPEQRARRGQQMPDLRQLPTGEAFGDLVAAAQRYVQMATHTSEPGRSLSALGTDVLDEIAAELGKTADALHFLGMPLRFSEWDPADWVTRALNDQFAGRQQTLWYRVAATGGAARTARDSVDALGMRQVQVPRCSANEAARMLQASLQLREYLAGGGKLRRRLAPAVQRAAQPLLDVCTVDGQPVAHLSDLDAVITWLDAGVKTAEMAQRWASVGVRVDVDGDSLPVVLSTLVDLGQAMAHVEQVGAAREAIDRLLVANGIHMDLANPRNWSALGRGVHDARALRDAQHGRVLLERLPGKLPPSSPGDPPELIRQSRAMASHDTDSYMTGLSGLESAYQEQLDQRRCDELLGALRSQHAKLADLLSATAADAAWEERLSCWPEAWAWGTAMAFCMRMRDTGRDSRLQQELDETQRQLKRVTEELAAARAWLHCMMRMSQEQKQALQSYRSAMSSLGKGTGRYASRHRRAARDAMDIVRDAVPAWIMPLHQVIETIPPAPDIFDVVIVDEASQAGLDKLFLLWLAPRVIVVGDDKQCAPSFAVQEHQKIFDRLDAYLPELRPAFRDDFRPGNNLYQLLSARFPEVIRLLEHFRCMPEIIGWSSKQFYDPPLQPLRQFGADRLPPLQVVSVDGGYTEGREHNIRNPVEAKVLVGKLHEMLADPAYADRTFGVIALQGTGQVRLIDDRIRESMDPALIEQHDVRVGTPPDFQGDERDVMLLSMVVTEPRQAMTRTDQQRRFNVAASRARDQMWLFTSVSSGRLSRDDLRFSLLSYMENPPSILGESLSVEEVSEDVPHESFDSLFEQRVFLAIRRRGYHVIPQFKIGTRRIDLVVSGLSGRLAVECDGTIAHSTPEQIRNDMERERELRRVGWEFWRVRESEFYFDPEQALAPLWEELGRRGIHPGVQENPAGSPSSSWLPAELHSEDDPLGAEDGD